MLDDDGEGSGIRVRSFLQQPLKNFHGFPVFSGGGVEGYDEVVGLGAGVTAVENGGGGSDGAPGLERRWDVAGGGVPAEIVDGSGGGGRKDERSEIFCAVGER